jgi:molybdenum cofactor cytidylyltransferase
MKTCGIIILAAGDSSRLGKAKQLLSFNNQPLLKHVLHEAQAIDEAHVIVVLGAKKGQVQEALNGTSAVICYNAEWAEGMASSIHVGVQKLIELQPDVNCCIISVCDQPYITAQIFKGLLDTFKGSTHKIIASSYADTAGTPVLFSKPYFTELLRLEGDQGAKKLLKMFEKEVSLVPFERGEIDIDTESDYHNLLSGS